MRDVGGWPRVALYGGEGTKPEPAKPKPAPTPVVPEPAPPPMEPGDGKKANDI